MARQGRVCICSESARDGTRLSPNLGGSSPRSYCIGAFVGSRSTVRRPSRSHTEELGRHYASEPKKMAPSIPGARRSTRKAEDQLLDRGDESNRSESSGVSDGLVACDHHSDR